MISVDNSSSTSVVYASTGNLGSTVMVHSRPVVEWMLNVADIEDWATTLEECMTSIPFHHRQSMFSLLCSFRAMLIKHQRQHEEVVTEAPTLEDLIDYLSSYAKHI